MTVIKVVYEGGVLKPESPVALQENGRYLAQLEALPSEAPAADDDDPTGWKTARELIGCITEEPLASDISEDHDRYIYRQ